MQKLHQESPELESVTHLGTVVRKARSLFVLLMVGCTGSWLIICTTTDAELLPIGFGEWFFFFAPVVLLGVYLKFLDRVLIDQPSVIEDHFRRSKRVPDAVRDRRTLISRGEGFITVLLVWWAGPLTLLALWVRYLPRHEWVGTSSQLLSLLISIGGAIMLHRRAVRTLKPSTTEHESRKSSATWPIMTMLVLGVVLLGLSYGAVNGVRNKKADPLDLTTWVPKVFAIAGYSVFADLRERNMSIGWEVGKTAGADLVLANLRFADAFKAGLEYARLMSADLQRADLRFAKLQWAKFHKAKLQWADLSGANLQKADLSEANLQKANLSRAILGGANLRFANNLTQTQLDRACGDKNTKLPDGLTIKNCPKPIESKSGGSAKSMSAKP